jgi:tetratricopeptide (TPR) repeat protein
VFLKAQGNPFFVDQTVSALVERAEQTGRPTIDYRRGRLLISEDELAGLVPGSVEEILLARIDKLPGEPRRVLQAASVSIIGRVFRRSALGFVTGEAELDHHLEVLQRRELIRLSAQAEADEEFVFEHALARDVAYNALLRAERRRLHGRMGEYIEDHYAASLEAYVDDLSYHYYNSPQPAKALVYLPQSAERAARSFSNQQAVMHFKRALEKVAEVGGDGVQTTADGRPLVQLELDLLRGLTGVHSMTGDREAPEYLQRRLDKAQQACDQGAVLDASYMLARLYTELGRIDDAHAVWRDVLEHYELLGDWAGVAAAENGIGNLDYVQGRPEDALRHFERAMQVEEEKLEFSPIGRWTVHNNCAAAYADLARFEAVLAACDASEAMIEQLPEDDPMRLRLRGYTEGNRGTAHRNLGHLAEAVASYRRTLDAAQQTGERNIEAEVRHYLGRTLALLGRLGEARLHLEEALVLARETASSRWEAGSLAALAELDLVLSDEAAAERRLAEAQAVLDAVGELSGAHDVRVVEARLALRRGHPARAAESLGAALAAAESTHRAAERVEVLVELARAELGAGNAALAAAQASEGLAGARSLGLGVHEARALLLHADLAGDDPSETGPLLDEAVALAEATGWGEGLLAALARRSCLRAASDPGGAQADLARAEAWLTELARTEGADVVERFAARLLGAARCAVAQA